MDGSSDLNSVDSYQQYVEEQQLFEAEQMFLGKKTAAAMFAVSVVLTPFQAYSQDIQPNNANSETSESSSPFRVYLPLVEASKAPAEVVKDAVTKTYGDLSIPVENINVVRPFTVDEAKTLELTFASGVEHAKIVNSLLPTDNPIFKGIKNFSIYAGDPRLLNSGAAQLVDSDTNGVPEYLNVFYTKFSDTAKMPPILSNELFASIWGFGNEARKTASDRSSAPFTYEAASDIFEILNTSYPRASLEVDGNEALSSQLKVDRKWGITTLPSKDRQVLNALYALGLVNIDQAQLLSEHTAAVLASKVLAGFSKDEAGRQAALADVLSYFPGYFEVNAAQADNSVTSKAVNSLRDDLYLVASKVDLNDPATRVKELVGDYRFGFGGSIDGLLIDGVQKVRVTPFTMRVKKNSAGTDIDPNIEFEDDARFKVNQISVRHADGSVTEVLSSDVSMVKENGVLSSLYIPKEKYNLAEGDEFALEYKNGLVLYVLIAPSLIK